MSKIYNISLERLSPPVPFLHRREHHGSNDTHPTLLRSSKQHKALGGNTASGSAAIPHGPSGHKATQPADGIGAPVCPMKEPVLGPPGLFELIHPQILPSNDSEPRRLQVKKASDKGLRRNAANSEKKLHCENDDGSPSLWWRAIGGGNGRK